MSQHASSLPEILKAVAGRWRRSRQRRAHMRELDQCGQQVESIASDLGMSVAELRRTAANGPDAAREVYDRLGALRLERRSIDHATMRDLERVCSQCAAKRRCRYDLEQASVSVHDEYCPNAETLAALAQAFIVRQPA
jgi:hypothetical protein